MYHRILYCDLDFIDYCFFIFDFKRENLLFAILIIALYCGLGALHFKASNEAAKGTSVGQNLSQGIGILLLIGFPVGTILGCIILYFTSKKRWQSDGNEVE